MIEAKKGREEQLKTLEDYLAGQEVGFKNHWGGKPFTATYDAAVYTRPRADVKCRFPASVKLLDAAAQCDDNEVRELLESPEAEGLDANVANHEGLTALHQACIEGSQKCASILLQNNADVNAKDFDWWTPLHAAAACGNWRIMNMLLSHGADVTAVNADGDLAFDIAEGKKSREILEKEHVKLGLCEAALELKREQTKDDLAAIVKDMIEKKISLDSPNTLGATPLHSACCNGWVEIAATLIENKVDVNAKDADGDSPLHLAVWFLQYKTIEVLAEAGADLGAKNRYHETPMIYAELQEDGTMIRILKALINKRTSVARASEADVKMRSRAGTKGASVKRKSMAEKQKTATLNMKQEREEAAKYANLMLGKKQDGDDAESGTVIYDKGAAGAGAASQGADPKAGLYAQPNKTGTTDSTPTGEKPRPAGWDDPMPEVKDETKKGGCCIIL